MNFSAFEPPRRRFYKISQIDNGYLYEYPYFDKDAGWIMGAKFYSSVDVFDVAREQEKNLIALETKKNIVQ